MNSKFLKLLIAVVPVVALLAIATMVKAQQVSGAIFTTMPDCTQVNGNIYASKDLVYVNGGPKKPGAAGLPDGYYYVQVTDPSGHCVLGTSVTSGNQTPVHVTNGEFDQCLQLCAILANGTDPCGTFDAACGYNDTPNNGGEYKVWVSNVSTFDNNDTKTDNFKVRPTVTGPTISCSDLDDCVNTAGNTVVEDLSTLHTVMGNCTGQTISYIITSPDGGTATLVSGNSYRFTTTGNKTKYFVETTVTCDEGSDKCTSMITLTVDPACQPSGCEIPVSCTGFSVCSNGPCLSTADLLLLSQASAQHVGNCAICGDVSAITFLNVPAGGCFTATDTLITAQATDGCGNIGTCMFNVHVNPSPSCSITAVANNGSVTLNANPSGGTGNLTVVWTKGGVQVGTGPSLTVTSTGTYTATVTDTIPCQSQCQYCVNTTGGGGLTLGFWSNNNGYKVLNAQGYPTWASFINGVLGTGLPTLSCSTLFYVSTGTTSITAHTGKTGVPGFNPWLLGANSNNAAYMLAAQLVTTELDVQYGGTAKSLGYLGATATPYTSGTVLILSGSLLAAWNNGGGAGSTPTIGQVEAQAISLLNGTNGKCTISPSQLRNMETSIQTVLNAINNNQIPLVAGSPGPCSN